MIIVITIIVIIIIIISIITIIIVIIRFTFWSNEKPYTRNCLINNDKFTVLLLCWNPSVKSAIHDHPCDACFIKVLRGCIKETKYKLDNDNNISQLSNNFHIENQVSYMNNSNVLHSISNPNSEVGAVTLHVYTPPFSACKFLLLLLLFMIILLMIIVMLLIIIVVLILILQLLLFILILIL